jgi:hypothetical protein
MLWKKAAGKSLISFHAILEWLAYYKNKHSPWFQQTRVTDLTTTEWIDERVVMWKRVKKTNEHKIPFPKNCHPSSHVLSYLRCFGPFEFRDCQPDIRQYKENLQDATQLYTGRFRHICTNISLKFYFVSWHTGSSHAIACSKIGMLCLDCDKLIKLQMKQMIELGIKRNLASETNNI